MQPVLLVFNITDKSFSSCTKTNFKWSNGFCILKEQMPLDVLRIFVNINFLRAAYIQEKYKG